MLEASGMEHIAKHISFTSGSGSFHENEIANIIEEQLSQTDLPDVEKSAAIKKRAMLKSRMSVMPSKISPENTDTLPKKS